MFPLFAARGLLCLKQRWNLLFFDPNKGSFIQMGKMEYKAIWGQGKKDRQDPSRGAKWWICYLEYPSTYVTSFSPSSSFFYFSCYS
jgi:hypothetical protein